MKMFPYGTVPVADHLRSRFAPAAPGADLRMFPQRASEQY